MTLKSFFKIGSCFPCIMQFFMKTARPRALKFCVLIVHIVVNRHVKFQLDSITSSKITLKSC